jgi:hypothetical protein
MPLKEDPPATPPVAAPPIVRGEVEVKTKTIFGRDKWLKAFCSYNPAARKFSCTDSTGKERRAMDCWLVDVANRQGKRQHRFDIESDRSQRPMALAAEGIGEKQRWVAAVETKEALRARQEQAKRELIVRIFQFEQELMVEHSESTIEEAQRKEAKAAQGQKEEEDCVTSVVWDTSMNTIAGIESTPSASLKFMPLRERSDGGVSVEEKANAVENVREVSEGLITWRFMARMVVRCPRHPPAHIHDHAVTHICMHVCSLCT